MKADDGSMVDKLESQLRTNQIRTGKKHETRVHA